MKIKNPKHTEKIKELAGIKTKQFDDYMIARAADEALTFDEIRAHFADTPDPKTGGALTDGTIHGICQALGYEVTE